MTRVVVAVDGRGRALRAALEDEGAVVEIVVSAAAPARAAHDVAADAAAAELTAALARAEILVIEARRDTLTAELVALCDRFGVRVAALCARDADRRLAAMFGIAGAFDVDAPAADVLTAVPPVAVAAGRDASTARTTVVWGPGGAPGRTTVAVSLAWELAATGRRVALVDADSHAPSVALLLGLADEGPGFAAACRQADRAQLTPAELTRIALPVGDLEVLTGINRPARWPELGARRVGSALAACREWVDEIVVDVAAPLEQDEEIVSDLDGPRRNAATLAALASADTVLAVVAADPVGVSRFVRAHPDLRAAAGDAAVRVAVNKTRSGALGIDPRGQVRRALERFCGIGTDVFLPWDPKAIDAATLAARPVGDVAARSPFARDRPPRVAHEPAATPAARRRLRRAA